MSNIVQLKQAISSPSMVEQFKAALPKHIDTEKFQRVVLTAISQPNSRLAEADRNSLFAAVMKAAQDGLMPDGREAAFVTFNSKQGMQAQYMPMIAGILKKVRNSGELASIDAQLVHKNDKFSYKLGIDTVPVHEPDWFGDRGEPIGVYAVAKTKDGSSYVEIMNVTQIESIRNSSRSKDTGPWSGPFKHEMWRKTVLRRLAKRLPMSTDLEQFVAQDDDDYQFNQPTQEQREAKTGGQTTGQEQPEKSASKKKKSRLEKIVEAEIETEAQAPIDLAESENVDAESLPI